MTALARRLDTLSSSAVRDLLQLARQPGMLSLAGGLPDPALLDLDGIADVTRRVLRQDAAQALQYGSTEGQPQLRAQLAALMQTRGATVDAGRILVTAGSQQALDLVARVLLDPGDRVATGNPTYLAALQVFALAQASLLGLPVDADGPDTDALVSGRLPTPKLVYLVPEFGNPDGTVLSRARREALLRWAVRERVWIVEDDPYGELRYTGSSVPSLLALARDIPGAQDVVIHVSTLSKVVAPGLRTGWLVAPPALLAPLARAKQALDLHTGTLAQEIAAAWLADGRLPPVLDRLRDGYRTRRDALVEALARRFGKRLQFAVPDGGMFVWARFSDGRDTARLLPFATESGVLFVPGRTFSAGTPLNDCLRLGFASLAPAQFDEAAARLVHACNWQDHGDARFPRML